MNGLLNKKLVIEAWTFLRHHNHTIPNETLDFMRDCAINELLKREKIEDLEEKFRQYYLDKENKNEEMS